MAVLAFIAEDKSAALTGHVTERATARLKSRQTRCNLYESRRVVRGYCGIRYPPPTFQIPAGP